MSARARRLADDVVPLHVFKRSQTGGARRDCRHRHDDAGRHQDRLGDERRDRFGSFQLDRGPHQAAIDLGCVVGREARV